MSEPTTHAAESLARITDEVVSCRACPRLVAWREACAANPPRRNRGEPFWARPVPGFGDPAAWLLVVGLAPAANGGNRTGRVFTGDSSGDTLFAAFHRSGLANQPTSVSRDDGLALDGAWIAAAVRCAPPDNRPTPEEFSACRPYLVREVSALGNLQVVLCLGALAFASALRVLHESGREIPRPAPRFGHGTEALLPATPGLAPLLLLGSYHPSRQNTNTGRLTPGMLDAVLARARAAHEERGVPGAAAGKTGRTRRP